MPLQRRVPKRGFTNYTRTVYEVVNVGDLARFDAGTEITVEQLREVGLIRRKRLPVKLLGKGAIERALTVRVHAASKSAVEKIGEKGGKVDLLPKSAGVPQATAVSSKETGAETAEKSEE